MVTKFKTLSNMIPQNDGENPIIFQCAQCSFRSAYKFGLETHVRFKHLRILKRMNFSCDVCPSKFKHEGSLKVHQLFAHSGEKYYEKTGNKYQCLQCSKTYTNCKKIKNHILSSLHLNIKYFHCKKCTKSFHDLNLLTKHKLIHKPPKFVCQICDTKFKAPELLKRHCKSYHINLHYECFVCNIKLTRFEYSKHKHKGFKKQSEYKNRVVPIEKSEKNETVKVKSATKREPNRSEILTKVKCNICGAYLTGIRGLRRHKKNIHFKADTKVEKEPCSICGKIYKNKSIAKRHIRLCHNGKKYHCTYCDYWTRDERYLPRHVKTHQNEEKHFFSGNCHFCNANFTQKYTLAQHIRSQHM